MNTIVNVVGSHKLCGVSGGLTTVAAGTASAGHVFAMRWGSAALAGRIRAIEYSCVLTTAFSAAQEVGLDFFFATSYSASHSSGTTIVPSKLNANFPTTVLTDARIGSSGALTNGTENLDTDAIHEDSYWAAAVGNGFPWRRIDLTDAENGGRILTVNTGIVGRNRILMGTAGVMRLAIAVLYDDILTAN